MPEAYSAENAILSVYSLNAYKLFECMDEKLPPETNGVQVNFNMYIPHKLEGKFSLDVAAII